MLFPVSFLPTSSRFTIVCPFALTWTYNLAYIIFRPVLQESHSPRPHTESTFVQLKTGAQEHERSRSTHPHTFLATWIVIQLLQMRVIGCVAVSSIQLTPTYLIPHLYDTKTLGARGAICLRV